jgi:hypothetical protein
MSLSRMKVQLEEGSLYTADGWSKSKNEQKLGSGDSTHRHTVIDNKGTDTTCATKKSSMSLKLFNLRSSYCHAQSNLCHQYTSSVILSLKATPRH